MIEIHDLSFGYSKDNLVLNNINLNIPDSTVTAILGRNGCGKTTLLKCIAGLNATNSVTINGKKLNNLSSNSVSKIISYIPQKYNIALDYSVYDFILFGRSPYLKIGGKLSSKDYDVAQKSAEECGVVELFNKSITQLSGGEMQLVYIARALTQETDVIIMDEPTSALDFGNQAKLFRIIKRLADGNKTVLFTTHNPNHIVSLKCNVVMMFDDGSVLCGGADELLTLANLEKIYSKDITEKNGVYINNV